MGIDFSTPDSPTLKRCKAAFSEWGVPQIRWCHQRAVQFATPHTLGDKPHISRSRFFDIFGLVPPSEETYSSDAHFLSLPLWVFALFDKEGDGKVSVLHILAALCMFGYGSLQDRVQTCFEVFDDDGNCMIDQAEMLGFMQSCIETMRAMDVMRKVPSEKVLKLVVEKLFAAADDNGDGLLQPDEFYQWASASLVTKDLMHKMKLADREVAQLENPQPIEKPSKPRTWDVPVEDTYAKHAQPWRQALGALDVNRKLVKRLRRAWQLLVPSYEDDEEPPEKLPGIDDWASTLKRTKTSFRLLAKAKDKLNDFRSIPGLRTVNESGTSSDEDEDDGHRGNRRGRRKGKGGGKDGEDDEYDGPGLATYLAVGIPAMLAAGSSFTSHGSAQSPTHALRRNPGNARSMRQLRLLAELQHHRAGAPEYFGSLEPPMSASSSGIMNRIAIAKRYATRAARRMRKKLPPPPGGFSESDSSSEDEFFEWFGKQFANSSLMQPGAQAKRAKRRSVAMARRARLRRSKAERRRAKERAAAERAVPKLAAVVPKRRAAQPRPKTPLTPQVLSSAFLSKVTSNYSRDTFLGSEYPGGAPSSTMMKPGAGGLGKRAGDGVLGGSDDVDSDGLDVRSDGGSTGTTPYMAFDALERRMHVKRMTRSRPGSEVHGSVEFAGSGDEGPSGGTTGRGRGLGRRSRTRDSVGAQTRGSSGSVYLGAVGSSPRSVSDDLDGDGGYAAPQRHGCRRAGMSASASLTALPSATDRASQRRRRRSGQGGRHTHHSSGGGARDVGSSMASTTTGLVQGSTSMFGQRSAVTLPAMDQLSKLRADLEVAMLGDLCRKVTASLSKKERKRLVRMLRKHEEQQASIARQRERDSGSWEDSGGLQMPPYVGAIGDSGGDHEEALDVLVASRSQPGSRAGPSADAPPRGPASDAGSRHSGGDSTASTPVWQQAYTHASMTVVQPTLADDADFRQTIPLSRSHRSAVRVSSRAD